MPASGAAALSGSDAKRPTKAVSVRVMSGSMRRAPAAGIANWRMRWPVVKVMDSEDADADDADVNVGSRASVSLSVLVVVVEVGPFLFSD